MDPADKQPSRPQLSRRHFLSSVLIPAFCVALQPPAFAQPRNDGVARRNRYFLTDLEWRILTSAADRIIPKDGWPSASEAGVVDYIDFQLATGWGEGSGLFRGAPHVRGTAMQGYQLSHTPAELFRTALAAPMWTNFAGAQPGEQDALLAQLERNELALGDIPGGVFFTQLRQSVIEGYFSDPIHNGNIGMAGWRMIGFPGAHAYYLTEVDRFELDYARPPSGIGYRPGQAPSSSLRTPSARERL